MLLIPISYKFVVCMYAFMSPGYISGSGISGSHGNFMCSLRLHTYMVTLYVTFLEDASLFSKVAATSYLPASRAGRFQFLHLLLNNWYYLSFFFFFYDNHPSGCEVVSRCAFRVLTCNTCLAQKPVQQTTKVLSSGASRSQVSIGGWSQMGE